MIKKIAKYLFLAVCGIVVAVCVIVGGILAYDYVVTPKTLQACTEQAASKIVKLEMSQEYFTGDDLESSELEHNKRLIDELDSLTKSLAKRCLQDENRRMLGGL